MSAECTRPLQCAIYTRKSSEEGLEQSFNSLDAQREACAAYIESQRHEGWKLVDTHYDDGGYSGGNMERPALGQLLADIDRGRINVVVVYKVDRLTRALNDFARIVQTFDAHEVSFVSITQAFNTTSSMGRLTLNVLLSFAQFEREVTGERIRDKIAASKRKGMWMGGRVPLGYDLVGRKLVINATEAEQVRHLFGRYAVLKSVDQLRTELAKQGRTSKVRLSKTGKTSGGATYSRGALYHILGNRLYLGETIHQGHTYPGEHAAIVSQTLWDQVQILMKENQQARRTGAKAKEPSLLAGLIYDDEGHRLTPSHTIKHGKRYRYYVSQARIQHVEGAQKSVGRIPARDIETLVSERLRRLLESSGDLRKALGHPEDDTATQTNLIAEAKDQAARWSDHEPAEIRAWLLQVITKISVSTDHIDIQVSRIGLRAALLGKQKMAPRVNERHTETTHHGDVFSLTVEAQLKRCSGEVRLIVPTGSAEYLSAHPNAALMKAIARAHDWYEMLLTGEAKSLRGLARQIGTHERYVSRIVRCVFLAPDVVAVILAGRQPPDLTLDKLLENLPTDWAEQRRVLNCAFR
ncbi:MAG: recombinase family protein [Gammaproteobacteria bacterium]